VLPVDPDVLNVELASLLAQPNATVERMPTESKESVEVCTNLMGSSATKCSSPVFGRR
jgi:hypothetical protein